MSLFRRNRRRDPSAWSARRLALSLAAVVGLAGYAACGDAPAARAQGGPPHAWLFGSWTGGLFPVPPNVPPEACLQQPVVIFTRDVVLRASLTDQFYGQRLIETARTSGNTTEFRFTPAAAPSPGADNGVLGLSSPPVVTGFGCGDPNLLRVVRRSANEISFPGCVDFPNPLVRCETR
jgi:hypothetical protein